MEQYYKEMVEKLIEIQNTTEEWRPDEAGVLEEEEEQDIYELIELEFDKEQYEETKAKELFDALSYLVSFCWEWFPDDWFDKEDLDTRKRGLEEADELIKNIKSI